MGGWDGTSSLNTGGRYTASTDTWTATATTGAPIVRRLHTAVWTGTEMIVWGDGMVRVCSTPVDATTPRKGWLATTTTGAPNARAYHAAVWVRGHRDDCVGGMVALISTPVDDTPHRQTHGQPQPPQALTGRRLHTAVWTGTQMIVWGKEWYELYQHRRTLIPP